LLKTDLRAWTIWWGAYLWPVWGKLLHSVKTGTSARKLLLGTDGFEHLQRDRAAAAVFNEAFREVTRLACRDIVAAYDFSGAKRVADIGGGYGQLLLAILEAHPHLSGILFDLPHATPETGLPDRCEFVAGDFMKSVPAGADVYLLKHVIHDWNDDQARLILENCRRAMTDEARLLVIERILPEHFRNTARDQSAARTDLTMLIAHSGRERTKAEFHELLDAAGFRVTRIVPAGQALSIIEARAACGRP